MLGATCPHAVYPQFPQAISSTATEQPCFGQRAGDNLWIPRGFLEESTGCPRIHAQCAQLAGIWGPSWGRAVDAVWTTKPVHSRPRFILELSPGHPQADTRCDLGKPAESTVSTGPITTPVLHLENFSSKQVVWTSLERTAPPHRAGRRSRGQRGRGRGAQRSHPRATTRCCTDLPIRAEPGEPESLRTHCGVRSGLHSGVRVTVRPAPHAPHPKIRNPVLTSDRTSGAGSACATSLSHRWQEQPPRHRGKFEFRPPPTGNRLRSCPHRYRGTTVDTATPSGARDYRPPGGRTIRSGRTRWFIHSCPQPIGPGRGDTTRSARPAWPGHRPTTYPPLGGAADRVARNGVRSDVGRLCQTPGAAGPDFRPPHRPPRRWRSRRSGIHGGSTAVDPH